jgi:hypothetical protein
MVGCSTGPLTVGPIIAAPTVTGCWEINDWSFSSASTPGDINVSLIVLCFYILFYHKYGETFQKISL